MRLLRTSKQSSLFLTLWNDTRGTVAAAGTILVTTIVAFGALVGLVTMRDHIVQQFGDLAVGLDRLNQTYEYEIEIDGNGDGDFTDPEDCVFRGQFNQSTSLVDAVGDAPACLNLSVPPANEGT